MEIKGKRDLRTSESEYLSFNDNAAFETTVNFCAYSALEKLEMFFSPVITD